MGVEQRRGCRLSRCNACRDQQTGEGEARAKNCRHYFAAAVALLVSGTGDSLRRVSTRMRESVAAEMN